MTQVNNTKPNYLGAFITMVVLMALIGFITSINQQFQAPLQAAFLANAGSLKNALATLLTFAFFAAYLVMGPTSAKFLEQHGYKKTLLRGIAIVVIALGIFEASALIYEYAPSIMGNSSFDINNIQMGSISLPISFFIFVAGSFVAGTGLTYLQASVNPYIVVLDVAGTSGASRQNIAGSGNSIMTTIGPLFIAFLVFGGKTGSDVAVSSIIIPMIVLLVFVAALYFIVNKLSLPEIAGAKKEEGVVLEKSVWSFSHLTLGVVAIFAYVGVEVAVGGNFTLFANELFGIDSASAASIVAFYWLSMLIGRLCGSFLAKVPAQIQLLISSVSALLLVVASMFMIKVMPESREIAMWTLIAVGLFHSIMWGAIFALAIDKLGKYTAKGSGALMMGVFGGALLPFIQGILADQIGWYWTLCIVVLGEAYLIFYALIGSKVKQVSE